MARRQRLTIEVWYETIECKVTRSRKSGKRLYIQKRIGFFPNKKLAHKAGQEFGKELSIDAYARFRRKRGQGGYVALQRGIYTTNCPNGEGYVITLDRKVNLAI